MTPFQRLSEGCSILGHTQVRSLSASHEQLYVWMDPESVESLTPGQKLRLEELGWTYSPEGLWVVGLW